MRETNPVFGPYWVSAISLAAPVGSSLFARTSDYAVMNSFPGIWIGLLLVDRFAAVLVAVFAGLLLFWRWSENLRGAGALPASELLLGEAVRRSPFTHKLLKQCDGSFLPPGGLPLKVDSLGPFQRRST